MQGNARFQQNEPPILTRSATPPPPLPSVSNFQTNPAHCAKSPHTPIRAFPSRPFRTRISKQSQPAPRQPKKPIPPHAAHDQTQPIPPPSPFVSSRSSRFIPPSIRVHSRVTSSSS